jgi:hypothetical protein
MLPVLCLDSTEGQNGGQDKASQEDSEEIQQVVGHSMCAGQGGARRREGQQHHMSSVVLGFPVKRTRQVGHSCKPCEMVPEPLQHTPAAAN